VKNVFLEYEKNEIILDKEKNELTFKMTIDCGNLIASEIASFTCEIEGISKRIMIEKKFYPYLKIINLEEIELLKVDYNSDRSSHTWTKILDNKDITKEGIYICHLGQWNFQSIKYIEAYNHGDNNYYKLEPVPNSNIIYLISEEGKIDIQKENSFEKHSESFLYFFNKK